MHIKIGKATKKWSEGEKLQCYNVEVKGLLLSSDSPRDG